MIDERRRLPEAVGDLVGVALRAYRRRFALYFGVALAGLVGEAILAYLRPDDEGLRLAGSVVVDALISALVTIGVIADTRRDERLTDAAIAGSALASWGNVALVTLIVAFVTLVTSDAVIDAPQDPQYALVALPIVIVWGTLGFASVIAAVDDKTQLALLPWSSIGRSMTLSLARQNIGRLIPLAVVAVLPTLLEVVLADQLALRKVAGAAFIGEMPIDAFVTGPLQAVFTIFYLDFVRRIDGPRAG